MAAQMNAQLTAALTEMKASFPYYNADCATPLPNQEMVCTILTHQLHDQTATFTFQENGAKVVQADLIYTLNGGDRYEEWFRTPASIEGSKVTAKLPKGTTHYYLNLVDENQFLRSYPEVIKKGKTFSGSALSLEDAPAPKADQGGRNTPFNKWDTNKDDILTLEEYKLGQKDGKNLEQRFKNFDKNKDGKVTRHEYIVLSAK